MGHPDGEQKRATFHPLARRLCGQRIAEVYYVALHYETGESYWDLGGIHSPEFGLDFVFESGETLGITWGGEFFQYALSFEETLLQGEIIDPAVFNVTAHPRWEPYLHRTIEQVIVYWYAWEGMPEHDETHPAEMELLFDKGSRIVIASAEFDVDVDPPRRRCEDHISIIFDETLARKCDVGRYGVLHEVGSENNGSPIVTVTPELICSTSL